MLPARKLHPQSDLTWTRRVTCVLGDVLQQERVLGEPLHLHRNDVFELQPTTQTVPLGLLQNKQHV